MNRTRTRIAQVFVFAFCLVTLGTVAKSQAQTPLKWSGKAGEKLKYVFNQTTEIKYVFQGQMVSNKSDLTVEMTWTIKSIAADGTLEVTQVAERVKARMTSAGRILEFDSKDKEGAGGREIEVLRKVYDAMLNQPYTLKISPDGEVVDVKVPDVVIAAVGDTPFAASADSGGFLSVKGVKVMMAQIIPTMPKAPVTPGMTWKSELVIPPTGPLAMNLKFDFKVDSVTPALVKFQSVITTAITPKTAGPGETPAPPIDVKLKTQAGGSTFQFDPIGGHLNETIMNQNLDMLLNANGTDIPQTIVISSSFKLAK